MEKTSAKKPRLTGSASREARSAVKLPKKECIPVFRLKKAIKCIGLGVEGPILNQQLEVVKYPHLECIVESEGKVVTVETWEKEVNSFEGKQNLEINTQFFAFAGTLPGEAIAFVFNEVDEEKVTDGYVITKPRDLPDLSIEHFTKALLSCKVPDDKEDLESKNFDYSETPVGLIEALLEDSDGADYQAISFKLAWKDILEYNHTMTLSPSEDLKRPARDLLEEFNDADFYGDYCSERKEAISRVIVEDA